MKLLLGLLIGVIVTPPALFALIIASRPTLRVLPPGTPGAHAG